MLHAHIQYDYGIWDIKDIISCCSALKLFLGLSEGILHQSTFRTSRGEILLFRVPTAFDQ